jgi:hypothetical protein
VARRPSNPSVLIVAKLRRALGPVAGWRPKQVRRRSNEVLRRQSSNGPYIAPTLDCKDLILDSSAGQLSQGSILMAIGDKLISFMQLPQTA